MVCEVFQRDCPPEFKYEPFFHYSPPSAPQKQQSAVPFHTPVESNNRRDTALAVQAGVLLNHTQSESHTHTHTHITFFFLTVSHCTPKSVFKQG